MNKQRLLVSCIGGKDLRMPEGQVSGLIWETVKVPKFDVIEGRLAADLWALEGSKVASFITSTLEGELR